MYQAKNTIWERERERERDEIYDLGATVFMKPDYVTL